ncbi:MAG: Hsp20 family protein [Acidobacteriia bacterium]|nr:Hsp20 family protein [Terriglobia bacterium]
MAAQAQVAVVTQPAKTSPPVKQTETANVFDRLQQSYDSIARRAFEIFEYNGRWFGHELDDWLRAESEALQPVHLDVTETDEALTVRAEVPGFATNELDITVEPRRLTIAGNHESKEETTKGKTIYSERSTKEILRSFELPAEVDGPKATATLKDGILNIELPKAAHAKTVRVEAKAAK